ncbi:MAG TPA: hypothetical protein VEK86_10805 [Gemmatimonadales bacterium]|nr:hypothetical protein [Gemmatimonadales bacterium]
MIRLTESARALLAVLSIFVIGAVAGVALDRTMLIPAHADAAAAGVRRGVPRHHDEVLAELRAELGLSAEQSRRVQDIFAAHQGELEAAWAQVHANLQRAMQQTTTEIETVLDSAQVERLHAWLAERHGAIAGHAGRKH